MSYNFIDKATEFSRDFELKAINDNNNLLSNNEILQKTIDFLYEEVKETEQAIKENDKEEIIDGFGDVAFVALNGIYKEFRIQGDDHDLASSKVHEVIKRICDANLGKKQVDGTIKYVNGKVQKPEGWAPPQYEDLVSNS